MTDIDIAEFLEARNDDSAKTAAGLLGMVRSLGEINERMSPDTRRGPHVYDAGVWALSRVLADIETSRALAALHLECAREYGPSHCTGCDDTWPCRTRRLLVAPHESHADFNPAWRISG